MRLTRVIPRLPIQLKLSP